MDRWEWRLRVSTWLSLYKWNESINLQHRSEEEHRGNRNRSNKQERDGLASAGRRQEANGAEGVPPCTRRVEEPAVAQGGWPRLRRTLHDCAAVPGAGTASAPPPRPRRFREGEGIWGRSHEMREEKKRVTYR